MLELMGKTGAQTAANVASLALLCICAGFWIGYRVKGGLHMLQQNSYFSGHYLNWVWGNLDKNYKLAELLPVIVFAVLDRFLPLVAAAGITALIYILLFMTRPKEKAKKPLVVTARVKRLIVTVSILEIGEAALFWRLSQESVAIVLLLLNLLVPFSVALANLINRPVEKGIGRWYYSDAKKVIASMPNLTVVGITGSYGKTSAKFILTRILSEKYHVLMTPESYNTTMGVVKTIRNMLSPSHEVFVCEMGAKYVGDIKEITDLVAPKYGLITSIGPQHLETFRTIERIVDTKYELMEALPDKKNGVLNVSSPLILENDRYPQAVGYGFESSQRTDYWAENISFGPFGSKFTVKGKDGLSLELETKLLGKHNIVNIVGAVAMAVKLGVEPEKIAYAVRRLEAVPHRLQLRRQGGITIIDDAFNSNVEGAASALEVLGSFEKGGRILITPGMIELGEKQYEYNYEFGKKAAQHCDVIILVGEKQTLPIQEGVKSMGFEALHVAKDLGEALGIMRSLAGPGSVVLLENDLPDLF